MDIHVSADTETALAQIAVANGVDVAQLVKDVIARFLEENATQLDAMRTAIDDADADIAAGRFTDYDEAGLQAFFEDVKREGRAQLAAEGKQAG